MKRNLSRAGAVALAVAFTVSAQTETVSVGVTTTAPTSGNPVVAYLWEMSMDGGTTWTTAGTSPGVATTITVPTLTAVRVRVRGRDILGGTGAWSDVSDPYTATRGNPGACGKPTWRP